MSSDLAYEAVTAPGECFDESGMFSGIVERLSKLPDGSVQIIVKIDENVVVPKAAAQMIARNHLPGLLQEGC